ncbi:BTB/POZ domain-containing protein-like protein [Salvia divinorum]|uniref:BTB/POZ domain-containing protein-like protein n=1 Tax=Salvia divinorum TaxID=28513 RepID=A0ABD1FWX8_SALDI
MSCMKLGSKADVFQLEGQSWVCTTGLPSDVRVEVGETSFHLHKFSLLSRSKLLEGIICDQAKCVLSLHDLSGGAGSFLFVAKFCYGVKFELTATNAVSQRCAVEHLQMTEDYGECNLTSQTTAFLEQVLSRWEGGCWPHQSPVWSGIHSASEPCSPARDRWHDDVVVLNLPHFKRLIGVVA